jgi:hypothetical protein
MLLRPLPGKYRRRHEIRLMIFMRPVKTPHRRLIRTSPAPELRLPGRTSSAPASRVPEWSRLAGRRLRSEMGRQGLQESCPRWDPYFSPGTMRG